MTQTNNPTPPSAGEEFVLTRVFDAPCDLIFKAWSECEHLMRWWGPKGFTMHTCKLDFRPGGFFHYGMRTEGGNEMWGRFDYLDIVPAERIAYTNSFSDEAGGIVRAPFSENWPLKMMNTITFVEENGKTTLTLRGSAYEANEAERAMYVSFFDSMTAGFGATLDQLDAYLGELRAGGKA